MRKAVISALFMSMVWLANGQDTIRASFETSPVCFGEQTQFINKTYVPSSLGTVDYLWKFAGQAMSTDQFGKHTFQLDDSLKDQAFPVTLVVTSRTNPPDVDSVTVNAEVYGLPKTWFTWKVTNDGVDQEVTIDSLAIDDDAYFYQWNLGGVLKSNDKRPVFGGSDLKPFVDGNNYPYTLFMRSPDGCENQYASTFMYDAVGVNDLNKAPIIAYPNPTRAVINFEKVFAEVRVIDLTGKELLVQHVRDQIDLSFLEPGQYFIDLRDGDRRYVQRITRN